MTLNPQSKLQDVSGIDELDKNLIKAFMQGAIYCWVKNRPDEPFAVHDLVGGVNSNWEETPLQVLYNKHIVAGGGDESATKAAGRDLGWLVKTVLNEDKRTFSAAESEWVNTYIWDGNEP